MKSLAAADRLRGAALRQRAVELRTRGWSYERIGAELGCSRQNAHRHVVAALEEIRTQTGEDAAALRTIELERLDAMLDGLWLAASAGDVPSVNAALRVGERRAKLCGLDAPTKFAGHDGAALVPARTFIDVAREISDADLTSLTAIAERTVATKGDPA